MASHKIWKTTNDSVYTSVCGYVYDSVYETVHYGVENRIKDYVREKLSDILYNSIHACACAAVTVLADDTINELNG